MKFSIALFPLWIFFLLTSCSQNIEMGKDNPEIVIFDTDMGSDCDDAGALALLHHYADMGKVEILGCIYSSGRIPYGAAIVEAINIYYGRPDIPIGACHDTTFGDPVDKMTAEKLARDTSAFHNTFIHNHDIDEQTSVNRTLLAASENKSITYITVGHTKGLYDLLVSGPDSISELSGFELVRQKVKRWVALGALNANNSEGYLTRDWNFFFNGTARFTGYLVDSIPVPVYFVNGGRHVMTGKSLKTTQAGNIVRMAYRDWLWNYKQFTLDDQRPSWDLVTVYYAIEGMGHFMKEEKEGWLEFDIHKGCRWVTGFNNRHQHYITQKNDTDMAFSEYLNERISK